MVGISSRQEKIRRQRTFFTGTPISGSARFGCVPDHWVDGGKRGAVLPHPSLSRWERGPVRPVVGEMDAALCRTLPTLLPLPAGEGWGEGENVRTAVRHRAVAARGPGQVPEGRQRSGVAILSSLRDLWCAARCNPVLKHWAIFGCACGTRSRRRAPTALTSPSSGNTPETQRKTLRHTPPSSRATTTDATTRPSAPRSNRKC